jgi:GT2 family glycosyltransferase
MQNLKASVNPMHARTIDPKPVLDLSVVIVNWNTRDLLDRCLQHVFASQGDISMEVIVVDNASSDGSPEMVRQKYPHVRLVVNNNNTGFSRANNQGIELGRGRYILLLNSDAFVEPGALITLVMIMDTYPETGAAGSRLLNEDGSLQRSAFHFSTLWTELWQALFLDRLFPKSRVFGAYRMTYWAMDDLREVDSVMGACMILRAETVNQVGGLDERYFMYSEEMDLCYRMKKAGWKVLYIPQAVVTHLWGGSSRVAPLLTFLRLYRSRVMFFRKHYGKVTANLYKLLLAVGSLARVFAGGAAALFSKRERVRLDTRNYIALLKEVWKF